MVMDDRNVRRVNIDRLIELVVPAGVIDMTMAVDDIER